MSDKLNFTISQSAEIRKEKNVGIIRDMTKISYEITTTSWKFHLMSILDIILKQCFDMDINNAEVYYMYMPWFQ